MLPATTSRVAEQTADHVNAAIWRQTEENVARYSSQGPDALRRRLEELDREWDMERALEANASLAALLGLSLGALVDRRFFIFPAIVAGFFFDHRVEGGCPPLPVLRRLGLPASTEI